MNNPCCVSTIQHDKNAKMNCNTADKNDDDFMVHEDMIDYDMLEIAMVLMDDDDSFFDCEQDDDDDDGDSYSGSCNSSDTTTGAGSLCQTQRAATMTRTSAPISYFDMPTLLPHSENQIHHNDATTIANDSARSVNNHSGISDSSEFASDDEEDNTIESTPSLQGVPPKHLLHHGEDSMTPVHPIAEQHCVASEMSDFLDYWDQSPSSSSSSSGENETTETQNSGEKPMPAISTAPEKNAWTDILQLDRPVILTLTASPFRICMANQHATDLLGGNTLVGSSIFEIVADVPGDAIRSTCSMDGAMLPPFFAEGGLTGLMSTSRTSLVDTLCGGATFYQDRGLAGSAVRRIHVQPNAQANRRLNSFGISKTTPPRTPTMVTTSTSRSTHKLLSCKVHVKPIYGPIPPHGRLDLIHNVVILDPIEY